MILTKLEKIKKEKLIICFGLNGKNFGVKKLNESID
jgi:hypothetical protein